MAGLEPLTAVPCHLDFTPRNLLDDADRGLAVIDLEHARYDLAARDLVRLADRIWRNRADLETAFLNSYGPLSELDQQVIDHCTHLDTLTPHGAGHRPDASHRPPEVITDPARPSSRPTHLPGRKIV